MEKKDDKWIDSLLGIISILLVILGIIIGCYLSLIFNPAIGVGFILVFFIIYFLNF